MLLAALAPVLGSGCSRDREAAGRPSATPAEIVAGSAAPAPAEMTREQRAELEARALQELRRELRPKVEAELRRELRPIVRAELERDLSAATTAERGPDAVADEGSETDAEEETAAAPARPDPQDLWSQPGTKIWPSGGGLKLLELEVGTALVDRQPSDVRLRYPTTPEVLYCYTVFENPIPDVTITHVWRRGSRLVSRVELEVGRSPKWRTWSKQRTRKHWTGLWSCEVLGTDGRQLGLTVFQIGG